MSLQGAGTLTYAGRRRSPPVYGHHHTGKALLDISWRLRGIQKYPSPIMDFCSVITIPRRIGSPTNIAHLIPFFTGCLRNMLSGSVTAWAQSWRFLPWLKQHLGVWPYGFMWISTDWYRYLCGSWISFPFSNRTYPYLDLCRYPYVDIYVDIHNIWIDIKIFMYISIDVYVFM